MRFFELLQIQHVSALIIIAIIFLILFGAGLGFIPVTKKRRESGAPGVQAFADGIKKGDGPYPLIIVLIITGTLLWGFLYILFYGISEVKL